MNKQMVLICYSLLLIWGTIWATLISYATADISWILCSITVIAMGIIGLNILVRADVRKKI